MPEPDPVADGNPDPFKPTEGLPIRDVLAGIETWRLEQVAMGEIIDLDGGPRVMGLHLGLLARTHDGCTGCCEPDRAAVVIECDIDAIALLVGEIAAALKPAARLSLAAALTDR